jgi:hypothetical protein
MPAPLNPNLWPSVLHDEDGVPISPLNPLPVTPVAGGGVGTTITSPDDVAVGIGATQALPAPPAGTLRMTVEVTDGSALTRIRVRELGGNAGAGRELILLGSTTFGGEGGAVAALEVENVAGPAAAVSISFEGI